MEVLKDVPIDKLKAWNRNPRKNDTAVEKLKVLIQKYGYIDPIVIDQDNIIRAGHTRLKALKSLGMETVPLVLRIEFKSEEDAIGYAITDNKAMEWSGWDNTQLKALLDDLDGFDMGLVEEEISDMKKADLELKEIIENGFRDYAKELSGEFAITFNFGNEYKEQILKFIKKEGKGKAAELIIKESEKYAQERKSDNTL